MLTMISVVLRMLIFAMCDVVAVAVIDTNVITNAIMFVIMCVEYVCFVVCMCAGVCVCLWV